MTIESIAKTLGTGSGIDTTALVEQLVSASFEVKNQQLADQKTAIEAQISGVSQLLSGITGFSSALTSLAQGGTLATQPTSSNTNIVNVSRLSGASLSGLSANIEVRQLAAAQVASTAPIADVTASVGTGTLTIKLGTATTDSSGAMTGFTAGASSFTIAITSTNSTLAGIRDAINARNTGVTASILTDADGSRLVLKGPTGATQAFTMTATENAGSEGLAALNVGVGATGTTISSVAQDAIVAVDGVAVKRSSNSITDLIAGVRLDLAGAQPGTVVSIGSTAQTENLSQTVTNFVDTYNQLQATLKSELDASTGALKSDSAARTLATSLRRLTLTPLITGAAAGTPTTLAEIGVKTNRDGTLAIDSTVLSKALAKYPDAVEAMFAAASGTNASASSGYGLPAALAAISAAASNTNYGLGASQSRYNDAVSNNAEATEKATDAAEVMRTRLTQQFATMDAKVAAYKSTQTFLQQQIDAWNSNDN